MGIIVFHHSIHLLSSQLLLHLTLIHSKVILFLNLNYLISLNTTKRKAIKQLQINSTALFHHLFISLGILRAYQLHLSIFLITIIN